jgi:type II secretory pathway pseudopilin PulG
MDSSVANSKAAIVVIIFAILTATASGVWYFARKARKRLREKIATAVVGKLGKTVQANLEGGLLSAWVFDDPSIPLAITRNSYGSFDIRRTYLDTTRNEQILKRKILGVIDDDASCEFLAESLPLGDFIVKMKAAKAPKANAQAPAAEPAAA